MLKRSGTITLVLDYLVNEEDRTVRICHPDLSGAMGFEYTTLGLAEVQLETIRVDKTRSPFEEIVDDATELVALSSKLKDAIKDLRAK